MKAKVYDLPTRLFHWLFAVLFIEIYAIAKLVDDESPLFSQHMILGFVLLCTAILRIAWGLFGSKFARFNSFPLNPLKLIKYFRNVLSTKGRRYFAHNPASAWAAVTMLLLTLGLGGTGYLMATGHKESFEDIHELLANGFAFVVVAHITGIILHSLRHRDGIALSMIHGKKDLCKSASGISNSHPIIAIVMAGVIGLFTFHIYKNYDKASSTTHIFGVKLQLGENKDLKHYRSTRNGENHNHKDED